MKNLAIFRIRHKQDLGSTLRDGMIILATTQETALAVFHKYNHFLKKPWIEDQQDIEITHIGFAAPALQRSGILLKSFKETNVKTIAELESEGIFFNYDL